MFALAENKGFLGRHGDVVLVSDDKAEGGKKLPAVLAEGEVTGHAHRVKAPKSKAQVEQIANETVQRLLRVTAEKARVDHEEHTTQEVPKGTHRIGIQAQWTPEGLKRVVD